MLLPGPNTPWYKKPKDFKVHWTGSTATYNYRFYLMNEDIFGERQVIITNADKKTCTLEQKYLDLLRLKGCVRHDARVTMADGSKKLAIDVKKGESLFNPLTGKSVVVESVALGNEFQSMYRVKVGSKELDVTVDHPFILDTGLVTTKRLKAGDYLANGQKVVSVTRLAYTDPTYVVNFQLMTGRSKKDHAFLANGVVTGDLYLQKKLASRLALESGSHKSL